MAFKRDNARTELNENGTGILSLIEINDTRRGLVDVSGRIFLTVLTGDYAGEISE